LGSLFFSLSGGAVPVNNRRSAAWRNRANNISAILVSMEKDGGQMKRIILVVGLLMALLTAAFVQANFVRAKAPLAFAEGAQLGGAYPEITHWPEPVVDEGAQLGSAFPEIRHWPGPVMQVGTRPHFSLGK
jgi:hypothetical protein